jgi:radical SAM protein with 4Fe4S-binding SPASM domain
MPNSLDIELTNRCNLDCPKCPRGNMQRPVGDMKMQLFKKIIDESYPYISFTWMHLFGEPLLNIHLTDMVKYASRKNISCGISTNATFLNQNIAKDLCLSGLDTIVISIDATTDQTYKKIRPRGDFSRVIKNTESFLKIPERKNIRNTVIQMIKMEKNQHEIDDFIRKWKGPFRKVHIKKEETWAGHFKQKKKNGHIKRFPCHKLWERLTVDWKGDVSICCRDFKMKVNLGNIEKDSFQKIWNSNKMIDLRKSLLKNQLDNVPLCKQCNEWIFTNNQYSNFEAF